jgi:hypothetical protein
MKIDSDNLQLFFTFICGCVCFWIGIRAKKVEENKQAVILLIFLGAGFFISCVLEIFKHLSKDNLSLISTISKIGLIIDGMILGIYFVMLTFGHLRLLKKPQKASS